MSTAPSRKLAMGLPLLVPSRPVAPRAKWNVPAWLPLVWMFPITLRNSMPNFNVCLLRVHVTRSLMMNVGRVVMFPTLTPALFPNCA